MEDFTYRANIVRIVDGDTVYVNIDLGFDTWIINKSVRLLGINTPETRTKNRLEKEAGYISKEYLQSLLPVGSAVTLISKEWDKFGRVLGDIVTENGITVTESMIKEEYAVIYKGGKRVAFDENFLINIINNEKEILL